MSGIHTYTQLTDTSFKQSINNTCEELCPQNQVDKIEKATPTYSIIVLITIRMKTTTQLCI